MYLVVLTCFVTWAVMAMITLVAVTVLKVISHFSQGDHQACPGCPAGIGVEDEAPCSACTDARKAMKRGKDV